LLAYFHECKTCNQRYGTNPSSRCSRHHRSQYGVGFRYPTLPARAYSGGSMRLRPTCGGRSVPPAARKRSFLLHVPPDVAATRIAASLKKKKEKNTARFSPDSSTGQMVGSPTHCTTSGHTHTHTQAVSYTHAHTLGFQDLDCLLSSLRALVYSAWILRAGTTRSPSDFVTTTKSALSMMPLLIPWTEILALNRGVINYSKHCK